jgi:hypothetical protein
MSPMVAETRAYEGASAATRIESRSYACSCGLRFGVNVYRAIDARADPEAAAALVAGRQNRAVCPACRGDREVQVSVVYHDPRAERLVLVLPDGLRHRELEERGLLYRRLADDGVPAPRYVREFEVAFGAAELRSLVADPERPAAEAAVPPSERPTERIDRVPAPAAAAAATIAASVGATPAALAAGGARRAATNDADAPEVRTVVRQPVPELRTAAIERWVANREGPSALLCGGEVVLCAALPPAELECFVSAELELRLQLHRLPTYPVLAVTVVTAGRHPRAIHALLEIGRAAHRAVADRLARESALRLELFDGAYAPACARELRSPLEDNLKQLFASAKQALQNIAPPSRSFDRARTAFFAPGYERLGRVDVALSPADLGPLDSPRAVRQAVARIAHWSEAAAEAYLVEIRSFPLGAWRLLRTDVVRRALDLGIHTPRTLTERVLGEAGVQAAWPDVLRRQTAAFAHVALGRRPNDLQPEEETANWRLLLEECRAAGVQVESAVLELAEGPGSRDDATGPIDLAGSPAQSERLSGLRELPSDELIGMLERRELRRDAALVICERREQAGLDPLFAALRKMTRAEANRVLPAVVVAFGEDAEAPLVEGLKSRKSFLRQGCALGLGTLGAEAAAEPLSRLLLDEPTDVWREVARALGDLGEPAVAPLLMRFREARSDGRDRVVRALAHVAASDRLPLVEKLAKQIDPLARDAARRAIGLLEEVRRSEAEVRGGQAPREQTMVRGFSRRFFEALGGDLELSDADVEEVADSDEPDPETGQVPLAAGSGGARRDGTNPDGTDPRISLPPETDV